MSLGTIIIDMVALGLAVLGFLLAFRQSWLRRLTRRLSGRDPAAPRRDRERGEDPVHYAMIIAGVMLMAFGLIMFGFTTIYALLTAP